MTILSDGGMMSVASTTLKLPLRMNSPSQFAALFLALLAAPFQTQAQESPPVPTTEEVVTLSPFIVSSAGDDGYRAANTLSGTRMNTTLFHTPAAISVLTKEFLDDIGAENALDMLQFAMSSGNDRNDAGLSQAFDMLATIRGFGESVITRDFLPNMVANRGILASDRFNIERADASRGPNSILYGASRPGGALNLSSKRALINGSKQSAQFTMGSFNKQRAEADLAFPLIKDMLALRTNLVWDDRDGWWNPEMARQEGSALAVTYVPFRTTQVRAGVEHLNRKQVIGGNFPHSDSGYTRWVMAGAPLAPNPLLPAANPAPGLLRTATAVQPIYAPQLRDSPFRLATGSADMRPDLPGAQPPGYWETINGANAPAGGTVDDPNYGQVMPANANLAGTGRGADYKYTIATVFLDQRIGDLNVELGYLYSRYFRAFSLVGANAAGDPNPVIPGAYYADGDSSIAGGRNPGTLLPDIARANPFVGLPYVQSQAQEQHFDQRTKTFRASLGYEINLTHRHPWLGRHALAASWQHDSILLGNGTLGEYNLSPNNTQPIDSTTNTLLRRTYLDFSKQDAPHSAINPWSNPIPEAPGMKPGLRWRNSFPWTRSTNTSWMGALQSRFPGDKIVVTAGFRHDQNVVEDAVGGGERQPNSTNLWITRPFSFDGAPKTRISGNTLTLGTVVAPWPWIAATYNRSESVYPQGNFKDIYGQILAPIEGRGYDASLRFNLLKSRLGLSLNFYEATGENQFQPSLNAPKNQVVGAANAVLNTLSAHGQPLPKNITAAGITLLSSDSRDASDLEASGVEFEVTGRIARGWSISMNYSENRLEQSNIASDVNAFVAEIRGSWHDNISRLDDTPTAVANFVRLRDGTPSRDFDLEPATFGDVYAYLLSVLDPYNRGVGKAPFGHVKRMVNAFTSFRFDAKAAPILRRTRIGAGVNYRGPAIIGYDAADNDAVIRGKSSLIANFMLGRMLPLRRGKSLDVQLNIQNLFKNEDLLPFSATAPGVVVRSIMPRVRNSWSLRLVYSF